MTYTKQQLTEDNSQLRSELDRTAEALAAVIDGTDLLVGQFTLDGQTVKARLINPTRAHGGLIMFSSQIGRHDKPLHRVHYLEQQETALRQPSTDYWCELRNLVGKARTSAYNAQHPMVDAD